MGTGTPSLTSDPSASVERPLATQTRPSGSATDAPARLTRRSRGVGGRTTAKPLSVR